MSALGQLLAVSAVVMGLSYTIAKERLFAPLRDRLGGKETWYGYLVSCPFCVSFWIAFAVVPVTGTYLVPIAVHWGAAGRVVGWFLSSVLVVVVAAFLRVGFFFLDETQGLVKREQAKVEIEKERLVREDEAPRIH